MTHADLQEAILACIPSESLKRAIRERKLIFEYPDLLSIVYRYARTFVEKSRLLSLLCGHADRETAEAAGRILAHEKIMYERFVTTSPGETYELVIEEKGGYEHRALCGSFETVLRLHQKFLKEYFKEDEAEISASQSFVLKRRIAQDEGKINCGRGLDDESFSCLLTPDGQIKELNDDQWDVCPDGGIRVQPEEEEYSACDLCGKICPHPHKRVVPFPEYLKDGDIVRCRVYGETMISVWMRTDSEEPDDNIERYCVLHLNDKSMTERIWHDPKTKYDVFFSAHHHPSAPETEKIDISELDEKTRDIYEDFMRFYKEYERERELAKQEGESES